MILAAIMVLFALDWWQENRELDALLDEVTKLEASTVRALDKWDQKCDYPGPVCRDFAYRASVTTRAQGAEVSHVNVLPWHRSIKEAQSAYGDHSDAWIDFWDDQAAVLRFGDPHTAIGGSFKISQRRFEEAVPPFPIFDQRQRISQIWAD